MPHVIKNTENYDGISIYDILNENNSMSIIIFIGTSLLGIIIFVIINHFRRKKIIHMEEYHQLANVNRHLSAKVESYETQIRWVRDTDKIKCGSKPCRRISDRLLETPPA
jgi:hypothetical protein